MARPPPSNANAPTASMPVVVAGDPAIAPATAQTDVISGWARDLGFDGVSLFHFPETRGGIPADPILWSTWGDRWAADYLAQRWFDVDPRVEPTLAHDLPCRWDGGTIAAGERPQRFFDAAANVGIRSGLAIPIVLPRGSAVVAFDSSASPVASARHREILERLGEAMWVANAIHASHCPTAPIGTTPPRRAPRGLSARERSCLSLSARGLTSRDIAGKLGIASRTVDFHIGNVLVKLAALNRHEAIAKAMAQGWLAR